MGARERFELRVAQCLRTDGVPRVTTSMYRDTCFNAVLWYNVDDVIIMPQSINLRYFIYKSLDRPTIVPKRGGPHGQSTLAAAPYFTCLGGR